MLKLTQYNANDSFSGSKRKLSGHKKSWLNHHVIHTALSGVGYIRDHCNESHAHLDGVFEGIVYRKDKGA